MTLFGNQQVQIGLSTIHEIRSSAGVVLSATEELMNYRESIENIDRKSGKVLFSLLNSISLMREQLELTDVIANPESITYGQPNLAELNGLCYKMVKVFESKAAKRNIDIKFQGADETLILVYNSFQLVLLALLDNAIKYSYKSKTIYLTLHNDRRHVEINVSSFGSRVPNEFRDEIFEKLVRGPDAHVQSSEGMGLGLFVARSIIEAHEGSIRYSRGDDESAVGNNDFIVRLPISN